MLSEDDQNNRIDEIKTEEVLDIMDNQWSFWRSIVDKRVEVTESHCATKD